VVHLGDTFDDRSETYLLRSRHGVYYLRMVIPRAVRHALGVPQREVRISLRTKDKQHARLELASRVSAMTKTFYVHLQSDTPWERESETEREERRQRYRHGAELIARYGEFDIDDDDQLDVLRDALGPDEFEDYIFVMELQRQKTQNPSGLRANGNQPLNQTLDRQAQRQGRLQDEKVRVAIGRFATHRRRKANQATVDKYVSQCELFLKIVAEVQARDPMLSDITVAHVQNYIDVLTKLPKKLSPKDTRSIATLIATDAERMSDRTKSAHAQAVNMLLSWCSEQLYDVQPNLNRILALLLGKAKRSNSRKYFTDEELKRFFSLEIFQTGNYKRASDYWVPIVITNVTASTTRRVDLVFGISYDDSIPQAIQVLEETVAEHPLVLKDPEPTIRVNELADSSVNLICRPWVQTSDYWTVYWDLMHQVKDRFDEVGISIPYPQRDIHLKNISEQQRPMASLAHS
jgi:hypothetical protein